MAPAKKTKIANNRLKNRKINYDTLNIDDVLCPICRTILVEPVSLPCQHLFCLTCFNSTIENNSLCCPICRLRIGSWLRSSRKNHTVIDAKLWDYIKTNFRHEVEAKANGVELTCSNTNEPVRLRLSKPGEIRQEYEKELSVQQQLYRSDREKEAKLSQELIKKLQEEELRKKLENEERLRQDAELAKELTKNISATQTAPQTTTNVKENKKCTPDISRSKYSSHKLGENKTTCYSSNTTMKHRNSVLNTTTVVNTGKSDILYRYDYNVKNVQNTNIGKDSSVQVNLPSNNQTSQLFKTIPTTAPSTASKYGCLIKSFSMKMSTHGRHELLKQNVFSPMMNSDDHDTDRKSVSKSMSNAMSSDISAYTQQIRSRKTYVDPNSNPPTKGSIRSQQLHAMSLLRELGQTYDAKDERAEKQDSITRELCHFKPIRCAMVTKRRLVNGEPMANPLVYSPPRKPIAQNNNNNNDNNSSSSNPRYHTTSTGNNSSTCTVTNESQLSETKTSTAAPDGDSPQFGLLNLQGAKILRYSGRMSAFAAFPTILLCSANILITTTSIDHDEIDNRDCIGGTRDKVKRSGRGKGKINNRGKGKKNKMMMTMSGCESTSSEETWSPNKGSKSSKKAGGGKNDPSKNKHKLTPNRKCGKRQKALSLSSGDPSDVSMNDETTTTKSSNKCNVAPTTMSKSKFSTSKSKLDIRVNEVSWDGKSKTNNTSPSKNKGTTPGRTRNALSNRKDSSTTKLNSMSSKEKLNSSSSGDDPSQRTIVCRKRLFEDFCMNNDFSENNKSSPKKKKSKITDTQIVNNCENSNSKLSPPRSLKRTKRKYSTSFIEEDDDLLSTTMDHVVNFTTVGKKKLKLQQKKNADASTIDQVEVNNEEEDIFENSRQNGSLVGAGRNKPSPRKSNNKSSSSKFNEACDQVSSNTDDNNRGMKRNWYCKSILPRKSKSQILKNEYDHSTDDDFAKNASGKDFSVSTKFNSNSNNVTTVKTAEDTKTRLKYVDEHNFDLVGFVESTKRSPEKKLKLDLRNENKAQQHCSSYNVSTSSHCSLVTTDNFTDDFKVLPINRDNCVMDQESMSLKQQRLEQERKDLELARRLQRYLDNIDAQQHHHHHQRSNVGKYSLRRHTSTVNMNSNSINNNNNINGNTLDLAIGNCQDDVNEFYGFSMMECSSNTSRGTRTSPRKNKRFQHGARQMRLDELFLSARK